MQKTWILQSHPQKKLMLNITCQKKRSVLVQVSTTIQTSYEHKLTDFSMLVSYSSDNLIFPVKETFLGSSCLGAFGAAETLMKDADLHKDVGFLTKITSSRSKNLIERFKFHTLTTSSSSSLCPEALTAVPQP